MRHRIPLVAAVVVAAAAVAIAQPKNPNPGPKNPGPGSGSAAGSAAQPGPGNGSGSAAGSAAVKPEPPPPEDDEGPGVDALRQEYLKLRDELFASRARAATVASQLFSTKISIKLTYTTGRMYSVSRASVRLDGASVYDNTDGAIANDDAPRFEGYVAPGRHVIAFRVEAGGKDDPRFTSSVESTVVVQAVAGKDLVVNARAKDGGDMPYEWKRKESGTYRLALDVDVKSQARPTEKKAAGKSGATRSASAGR
jgi:hypothetical protein